VEEDVVLTIFSREIVILYNIDNEEHIRPWENSGIFICDPEKNITLPAIVKIIEYLYEEGFIDDRRTPYEILTDDK